MVDKWLMEKGIKNSKVSNFAKPCCHWIHGADFQTRTGDPILTMDVLYLLS